MIWAQALAGFVIWVGFGWLLARRSPAIHARLAQHSRNLVVCLAIGCILLSLAALVGGLYLIGALGGLLGGALTPIAWAATVAVGIIFVWLQGLGAAVMVSLAMRNRSGSRNAPGASHVRFEGDRPNE